MGESEEVNGVDVKELPTENGVYKAEAPKVKMATEELPSLTGEEADNLKEQENVKVEVEGGI